MTVPTTRWDSAAYLRDDDEIAEYLNAVLEEDDPILLTHALGIIARAKGMMQLAHDTGLTTEQITQTLSPDGHPELAEVLRIVGALGLQLHASRRLIRSEESA
ncbi:putative addiction module antidote protein [Chromatium weissei]|nr:putative addiction module antidote protein [Chromatium weissei]